MLRPASTPAVIYLCCLKQVFGCRAGTRSQSMLLYGRKKCSNSRPLATSHVRMIMSEPAVATRNPSALRATSPMATVCANDFSNAMLPAGVGGSTHVRVCLSALVAAIRFPSALIDSEFTAAAAPARVPSCLASEVCQTRIVLSALAVTSQTPAGPKTTPLTAPAWPAKVRSIGSSPASDLSLRKI